MSVGMIGVRRALCKGSGSWDSKAADLIVGRKAAVAAAAVELSPAW